MNQEQAKTLIGHLLFAAQKAKSNMSEALAGGRDPNDVELSVLKTLHPDLYDESYLQLVEVLYTYGQKATLEPTDVYNALFLSGRNLAVSMCYMVLYEEDLPDPKDTMLAMMNAERGTVNIQAKTPSINAVPVAKPRVIPSLEEYYERGRQARAQEDAGKWWLCDVAAAVVRDYPGRHTLRDFAQEVGIGQSTARERARMGRRYPKDIRKRIWPDDETRPNVHYRHLRDALAIPTIEDVIKWCDVVSEYDYSVDRASAELPKWLEAMGLEAIPDEPDDKPKKTTVCSGIATRFKALDKVDNVWKLTLYVDENDPVAEKLSYDLDSNYKNRMLKLTLNE